MHVGPIVEDFTAIEALTEASEAAGWTLEYRQLEAGRLQARTVLQQIGHIPVIREGGNRRMEVVGEAPEGMVSVFIPTPGTHLNCNGQTIDETTIVLLPSRAELDAVYYPGPDLLSLHVDASALYKQCEALLPASGGLPHNGATTLNSASHVVDALRRTLVGSFSQPANPVPAPQLEAELIAGVARVLGDARGHGAERDRYHRAAKRRILVRAREYIETHLNEPIAMADLCAHAGTSLSTLERLFRRDVGMAPFSYIRARRLGAIRRALARSHSGEPIARIARDHGFTHMGRFSAAYRRHFGQLPSSYRNAGN